MSGTDSRVPIASAAGPTVSFGFNLAKVPDHGEDSDPILRDGPDLGLLAVFDGMGGAGGTVYDTEDGPRTGAYLASRIARDVVEQRMLDLLVPDWNLKGEDAAADLQQSVKVALQHRLAELRAPKSGLRSRLLRALPTTMSVVALQRTRRSGSTWLAHVFWAGDSRAYVFEPGGARQLSTDDLRDKGDAMSNLRGDSVVSNAMSADTDFHVSYRRVELEAPFVVACATDGCFGYVPSPMHFEQLVLQPLVSACSVASWSQSIQTQISATTGDDAAMSVMAVGADFPDLQSLYAPRVEEVETQFVSPIDELGYAVSRAKHQLQQLQQQQRDDTQALWEKYRPGYERYLHCAAEPAHEQESEPPPAEEPNTASVSSARGAGTDSTSARTQLGETPLDERPEHEPASPEQAGS